MAKSKKQTSVPATTKSGSAASGTMAAAKPVGAKKSSEIDDIFSSKPKPKAAPPATPESPAPSPSVSSAVPKKGAKKKRKASEAAAEADASDASASAAPSKPKAAASGVKVVEFSEFDTGSKPASAPAPSASRSSEPASKKRKVVESMDEFLGNNGKKRFTEDGYPLYYIEDLLAKEGGDTDLCPFECECCF